MLYPNLKFPKRVGRPFFYTNFVATVDGKVQVLKNSKDYWPIGSKTDYQVLLELRAYADYLIHGSNLASEFGEITLNSLNKLSFAKMRKKLGRDSKLPYCIITSQPKKFAGFGNEVIVAGSDLRNLSQQLHEKGYKNVLVEGGPTLLASFLKADLLDEIFLTIAPRIFGNEDKKTLSLVEGYLFPKNTIKNLSLLSIKRLNSEI
ncbi:MAG: RibD family protein, partial [Patescibacteria group bacterium]|nr:RibD family protein [Patescibacteria group bacterium]